MKDLTHGKPAKIILYFALPILIGNLFNLAYNLADTRIVGTYLGNDALAAVGSISTLNDLLVGFVVGLANGFAVITAQHFGSGDREKSRKVFALSILMGLIVTAVIVAEGKTVKVQSSATKYATGQTIPSWVKSRKYTVQKIDGDRALLKEITSWVKISDLELA